jgi:hypothetical protein
LVGLTNDITTELATVPLKNKKKKKKRESKESSNTQA